MLRRWGLTFLKRDGDIPLYMFFLIISKSKISSIDEVIHTTRKGLSYEKIFFKIDFFTLFYSHYCFPTGMFGGRDTGMLLLRCFP
jgi:hypothetical protein